MFHKYYCCIISQLLDMILDAQRFDSIRQNNAISNKFDFDFQKNISFIVSYLLKSRMRIRYINS